mmetsp:Transcript_45710/g.105940  ORF Transcript_45710/g.105940 Transcript_45710/m.105940 type:complete len:207 (+) Transcript_45710:2-622(+)
MLPMPATPPLMGELTPEMQDKLTIIRYCVYGIFFAAIGRFCTGDIPFNELMSGCIGVFLLKDDENIGTCYACLASSILGNCAGPQGGGLPCTMPFFFVAGFNCIFLAVRIFVGGPFLLVSFCFQFMGAMSAWRLNQLVTLAAMAELTGVAQGPGQSAQMGLLLGAGGGGDQPGAPGRHHGDARAQSGPRRFDAFTGQAHRLVDDPL